MNQKQQTINSYNKSAKLFVQKFEKIGPRITDIERTFNLCHHNNPFVVEIGCGPGRDAQEILKRTNKYLGIDLSRKFIQIAKKKVPQARFILADMESFNYPTGIDIVFAFASLLHTNERKFKRILDHVYTCLNPNGLVYISLKYRTRRKQGLEVDGFGKRLFYYYNLNDIKDIIGKHYQIIEKSIYLRRVKWIELILQKN